MFASRQMLLCPPGGSRDPLPLPSQILPHDPSLCPFEDLVEKTPCTWNSSRVCECRSGMFCTTSATNSCARCTPRSSCPPGTVTKPQGKLSAPPTNGLPSVPLQLDISSPPHWANDLQPQLLTRSGLGFGFVLIVRSGEWNEI